MSTARATRGTTRTTVRIPADVERPDRILAGLTARQCALLGSVAVGLWMVYAATRHVLRPAIFGIIALPIAAIAVVVALGRIDGIGIDHMIRAAWRQRRSPRRLVTAPEGVRSAPLVPGVRVVCPPLPGVLRLPLAGISPDGVIDLGTDGAACICRASSLTFSLRTPAEQEALVAGFARYLNSLGSPLEVLVRAEPVELTETIEAILDAAPGLAHPGLEAAAREHARFLVDLTAYRHLLRREVLIVLREVSGSDAPTRLVRRTEEATAALGAVGIVLVRLDGAETTNCLLRALDPGAPSRPVGLSAPGVVISGGTR